MFAPMRQGPVETGVAVLAVDQPLPVVVPVEPAEQQTRVSEELQTLVSEEQQTTEHTEGTETAGIGRDDVGGDGVDAELGAPPVVALDVPIEPLPALVDTRPVVLTARYRHTLKGPDRGKWELEMFEEADAPLATIEMVVRGVQQRLDDASEPERLGAEHLRAALAEGVWTPPQR